MQKSQVPHPSLPVLLYPSFICYNSIEKSRKEASMDLHVSKNIEEWRETTARQAKDKTAERQAKFITSSHIEVPDLATEEDLQDFGAHAKLGYAGEFPFTRGIHPG